MGITKQQVFKVMIQAKEAEFKSGHNLPFESAVWEFSSEMSRFRIGTCEGIWGCSNFCYYILAVDNKHPGNGHLTDVFEWFENSCNRDNKNLCVLQCFNNDFYKHLINKRGFIALDSENVIKVINKKSYKKFLKKGIVFNPDLLETY